MNRLATARQSRVGAALGRRKSTSSPPLVDYASWPLCGPQISKRGRNDVVVRYWPG
jgi:hypothetical protein